MKIADLKPAPYNPRKISDAALAGLKESIRRFGLVQPIVWNKKTKRVVSGHQRLKAMAEMGDKEAVVVVVDWPETKELEANIAFNNKAIEGEFTDDVWELLKRIEKEDGDAFESLRLGEIDAPALGVEEKELDEIPKPPAGESRRNTMEVWEMGRHRLICGSCTDKATVEKLLQGRKPQCVFTDPPYGVDYEAKSGKFTKIKGDDKTGDKLVNELLVPALKLAAQAAKDDAAFYVWHPDVARDEFSYALKAVGLQERQYLIWAKPAAPIGWRHYHHAFEPCFYASKAGQEAAFYGDRTNVTIWRVAARNAKTAAMVIGPGVIVQDGNGGQIVVTSDSAAKLRSIRIGAGNELQLFQGANNDVWEVRRDGKADHPTQKPVELARRAIVNSTEEGDLVYDPFMGSGSMLMAAEVTDRRAAGCELERKYCEVIVKRWEKLTGQKAILI
jgi:DNA modification methylase